MFALPVRSSWGAASDFYNVPPCLIRVLAARPLRVREYSTTELFGDYHPSIMLIPSLYENSHSEGDHFIRNFSECVVSRVPPSSRLPSFPISGLLAYSRFLTSGRVRSTTMRKARLQNNCSGFR